MMRAEESSECKALKGTDNPMRSIDLEHLEGRTLNCSCITQVRLICRYDIKIL